MRRAFAWLIAVSAIALASDGRIRGRVVDARGQPVGGLPVELVTRVQYGLTRVGQPVATSADGTYEFTRVPPGTADPGAAAAVLLGATERATAADLVITDASGAVRMAGRVRTPDGQPVEGARVYFRIAPPTSRFFFGPPAVSDRSGEFL